MKLAGTLVWSSYLIKGIDTFIADGPDVDFNAISLRLSLLAEVKVMIIMIKTGTSKSKKGEMFVNFFISF